MAVRPAKALPRGGTDRQDEAVIKSRLRMPVQNLSVTYELAYICGRMFRKFKIKNVCPAISTAVNIGHSEHCT